MTAPVRDKEAMDGGVKTNHNTSLCKDTLQFQQGNFEADTIAITFMRHGRILAEKWSASLVNEP